MELTFTVTTKQLFQYSMKNKRENYSTKYIHVASHNAKHARTIKKNFCE